MTTKVMDNFHLDVGNYDYVNWSHMRIKKSMLYMAGEFSFETFDYTEGDWDKWKLKMGDEAKAVLGNTTLCHGYIDMIPMVYGEGEFSLQFAGRDKTADLVDCTYEEENNEFKNQTVLAIVRKLCSPFNITVSVEDSANSPAYTKISTFKASEGVFVSDLIIDICRDVGVIPISLGDGKLTLTKGTGTGKTNDPIQYNVNASKAMFIQSDRDRYSSYTAKGYGIGNDEKTLSDYITPSFTVTDSVVSRNRSYTLFMDRESDTGRCKTRARWEARMRAALSRYPKYKITGWTQSNGDIWEMNKLVKVEDSLLGISDTLLIIEAEYLYDVTEDDRGNQQKEISTLLTVVDKDIFTGGAADINIRTRFD